MRQPGRAALARLNARRRLPWTTGSIPAEAATSRGAFIKRFIRLVGKPPSATVAGQIGYGSECSFPRAHPHSREPSGRYRRQSSASLPPARHLSQLANLTISGRHCDSHCMTVRATWNGTVLAESDRTILVEGNHYFPPGDVRTGFLQPGTGSTHCPWKGDASYYSVVVAGERSENAAWYYPEPYDAAALIKDYIAFWKGVEVSGANVGAREILPPARR